MKTGVWQAVGAYVVWGLFPLYWKQVEQVPALQLIGHRILWSFLTLAVLIAATSQRMPSGRRTKAQAPRTKAQGPKSFRVLTIYTFSAVLISVNWFTYVWGVNSGFVVETSLGYFVNPLVSVLFGVLFLRERLRPLQWAAVAMAATGVAYLTFIHGSLPWIALVLAFSFGSYGFLKKTAPLGSLDGLTLETGLLFIPALGYLAYSDCTGQGAFLHAGAVSDALLIGAGPVTTVPLLLFASAARRIPLSLMGVLQYIAPTLQFLFGVLLYREPFTRAQLVGFALVWAALLLFTLERLSASSPRPGFAVRD
jgi:chloramphenicol-sensitive protein RarD